MNTDEFLADRRRDSNKRLAAFCAAFRKEIPRRERRELLGDHTCVYAVGSGGRGELSRRSDIDVFLVTNQEVKRINEVRLQTAVLRAMRKLGFPDPSNDASFVKLHASSTLIERLGEPADDAENTFTVRMLLLLESKPVAGSSVHSALLDRALDAYWKNAAGHERDYLPIILLNDIIRYWRILLLNYESKTASKVRELADAKGSDKRARMAQLQADRWLRSYKLRFSRSLMCYSSVCYLLANAHNCRVLTGTACVTKADVGRMVRLVPLDRLDQSLKWTRDISGTAPIGIRLRELYAQFLKTGERDKRQLLQAFGSSAKAKHMKAAEEFGQQLYELVELIGHGNPLHRYVVV